MRMLHLLTVALTVTPLLFTASLLPAEAQSSDRVYRLDHLAQTEEGDRLIREFTLPELARLGFAEGRDLHFSGRFGRLNTLIEQWGQLLRGLRTSSVGRSQYISRLVVTRNRLGAPPHFAM